MKVSREEILHIAKLANLNLKEEEIENYILNLQDILNYADGAYRYIIKPETIYDKEEIIYAIKSIPECVENIKELLNKLEEHEDEQL